MNPYSFRTLLEIRGKLGPRYRPVPGTRSPALHRCAWPDSRDPVAQSGGILYAGATIWVRAWGGSGVVARESYQNILDLPLTDQLDAAWICSYPFVLHQTDATSGDTAVQ